MIDKLDAVIYTFQFIVPGYIIGEVISMVLPRKDYTEGEKMIQAVGYSIFNMAIWYWLFVIIQENIKNSVWFWIANAFAVLLTGGITGFVLGIIRKEEIIRKFFKFFKINLTHPAPTAWDYKFSDGKEYWVEITVANGNVLRGRYSGKSLSSSDISYKDIYLEELYIKPKDKWKIVEKTAGVWVNPEEIRYIKFYDMEV